MQLITDLKDALPIHLPCGLTIGSFDGVHLGHQALLKHLRAKLPLGALLTVFTFSNHPSHHFAPDTPTPLICSPMQKAKLLAEYGADIVILTPFTPEFSQTPFDQFLRKLKQKIPFSHLVLGINATFGKNKEGNEENVRHLAPELGFHVEYLPKLTFHDVPLSSRHIRSLIAKGALHEVQECLGRHYSLVLTSKDGSNAEGLCLPPEGIYAVRIKISSKTHLGRALVAPKEQMVRIELLHGDVHHDEKEVEIIF